MTISHWPCIAAMLLFSLIASGGFCEEKQEYFETFFPKSEDPESNQLKMDAEWRIWIPAEVETLRGVVVHQHGCGAGSSEGGRTAVYDLHWQELARKHDCALIAVSYRQGDELPCNFWCDPRNGSAQSFLKALDLFAEVSAHPELKTVPWALWGHSGGGHWVGSMVQLYPERIAGAWLRSGCPDTVCKTFEDLPMNEAVLNVPIMVNLGAKEFDRRNIWDSCWSYFTRMREKNAKIGIIIDPNTHHETGNSRYPAIRFLDDCLTARLPAEAGSAHLRPTPEGVVLPASEISDAEISAENYVPDPTKPEENFNADWRRLCLKDGIWFLNQEYIGVWRKYSLDNTFEDTTPPPAPTAVTISADGLLTWQQRADLESGLRTFVVYCNGEELATLPTAFAVSARPVFQGEMYSDTPDFSLPKMEYQIENFAADTGKEYSVAAINTAGLISSPQKAVSNP
ncbi:MAG: hypothetical protein IKW74_07655 [Thermoguttaceae bacterium]|nr:hypothetical protein [Thermoguttaceae bacterium]